MAKLLNYFTIRGETALKAQQFDQAREDCDQLLKLLDEYYSAHYSRNPTKADGIADTLLTRARAFRGEGNQRMALADLNESLEVYGPEPIDYAGNYIWTFAERADLLFELGDHEAALNDYNRVIEMSVDDDELALAPAYRGRAAVHRALGNDAAASADEVIANEHQRTDSW